jgi:hypothetical protein
MLQIIYSAVFRKNVLHIPYQMPGNSMPLHVIKYNYAIMLSMSMIQMFLSVLASSVVDRGLEPLSGQTKDNKIYI